MARAQHGFPVLCPLYFYQAAPPKAAKKPSVAKTILIAIVVIIAILVYIIKKVQFY